MKPLSIDDKIEAIANKWGSEMDIDALLDFFIQDQIKFLEQQPIPEIEELYKTNVLNEDIEE